MSKLTTYRISYCVSCVYHIDVEASSADHAEASVTNDPWTDAQRDHWQQGYRERYPHLRCRQVRLAPQAAPLLNTAIPKKGSPFGGIRLNAAAFRLAGFFIARRRKRQTHEHKL